MKILQIHNRYFSGMGGEDTVVRLEEEMLRSRGHDVRQVIFSTSELKEAHFLKLLQTGISSVWSRRGYECVAGAVLEFHPDVVHVHNTFPLLSPSVYYAARRHGACVVQTLHNYRIACTNGLLFRDGSPCEDCVGRSKWRGVVHRCYHGSLGISGSIVAIQTWHRAAGTYNHQVDAYIALTQFQKDLLVRDGLPVDQVHVKPNFIPSPISRNEDATGTRKLQFVCIGNIGKEKGTDLLLEAWTRIRPEGFRLLLLGHGPLREELRLKYERDDSVIWMGFEPAAVVAQVLAESRYIVIPSRWYEGFPMVLLEAMISGTPAIAPNHSAFPEILELGKCGYLFEPSSIDSLTAVLRHAMSTQQDEWREQSSAALARAGHYNAHSNYEKLIEIYAAAQAQYLRVR